jgi:glutamate-1-semialdehyde 2,1-aminomutase
MTNINISFDSKFERSGKLYRQAQELFPFGVQLFSRRPELGPLGHAPIYFDKAHYAHFWDVDGNEFIDTLMGVGPVTLGYSYEPVDQAVKNQIDKGIIGSVNHPLEIEMADILVDMIPCAEMVKFCKSGGEADAIAVRLARGHTGKDVVLFCGYHGWHDWYLAANLTSQSTLNAHLMPGINPKGVPGGLKNTCIPFEYNNLDALRATLEQYRDQVACIIMEPTRFKHPSPGYLSGVRQLADEYGCLMILDEVITGFRMAPGSAQQYYGVTPHLATFAKAIANGYPLAAVVGLKDVMAGQTDNFISSTYWSDTTALAAGVATAKEIRTKPVLKTLSDIGKGLMQAMEQLARKHQLRLELKGHGYNFAPAFDYGPLNNKILTLYMQEMIARGIYVSGIFYICFTHSPDDVAKIIAAADETFDVLAKAIQNNNIDEKLKCPERKTGFQRLV